MQTPRKKMNSVGHDCLHAVHALVALQRNRIAVLEQELHRVAHAHAYTRALLLHQQTKTCLVTVQLERQNGSLGFTIAGGDESSDSGSEKDGASYQVGATRTSRNNIVIAKVKDLGPAHGQLHPNDQLVRVNGQDLSGASHEEAVEAFRLAKEPIVVEVLRRAAASLNDNNNVNMNNNSEQEVPLSTSTTSTTAVDQQPKSLSPSPSLADATTQTDWTGDVPIPNGVFNANNSSPIITKLDIDHDVDVVFEGEIDDSFDDPRNYEDIEYEEVTLHSSDNQDKLGLTLCCGGGEDDGAIFVSEIAPCGIAAQDGRIQEGDQILQVNGVDVVSRDQVVNLFSQGKSEITIVVARPHSQDELYLDESYLLEHPLLQVPQEEDEDNLALLGEIDSGNGQRHDKDSGVGRTEDGSTCNGESSEGPCSPLPPSAGIDCDKDEPVADDEYSPVTEDRLTTPDKKCDIGDSEGSSSIERELALLNQEMTQIQIECQNIVRAHATASSNLSEDSHLYCNLPVIPPALPNKSAVSAGHKPCPLDKAEAVEEWVKSTNLMNQGKTGPDWETSGTSSSAYNTGDSCRSTPLTLELHVQDKSTQLNADSDAYSVYSCESCRRCLHLPPPPPTQPPPVPANNSSNSQPGTGKKSKSSSKGSGCSNGAHRAETTEKNQNYVTFVPPSPSRAMANTPPTSTMYTNEANLEHTIWLQQQLFRQSLLQKQQQHLAASSNKKMSCPSSLSTPARKITEPPTCNSSTTPMEWKVKRRADGTRYITRRPVRNRLLKERANRLNEERGLTTDDDNASELKWGRYWSKEDRKRHLERAKDHKRKREMILRMRSAIHETPHANTLPGHCAQDPGHGPNNNPILELSHKKMMRKKGMTLFDDFTTVQEVLAHGTRGSAQGSPKTMGLLSVTTV